MSSSFSADPEALKRFSSQYKHAADSVAECAKQLRSNRDELMAASGDGSDGVSTSVKNLIGTTVDTCIAIVDGLGQVLDAFGDKGAAGAGVFAGANDLATNLTAGGAGGEATGGTGKR